jgi:hypothetical protein
MNAHGVGDFEDLLDFGHSHLLHELSVIARFRKGAAPGHCSDATPFAARSFSRPRA